VERTEMNYVAFSGGIDSTALALMEPEAVPVFTDTGAEFRELYAHIERFEQVTGREVVRLKRDGSSLLQYISDQKFMPNHGARYCTRMFKIDPLNVYLRDKQPCELLVGLRADEEERIGNLTEMEGLTIRYPLREKGIDRVGCVAMCMEHGLLPRYPVYMVRGGCVNCFYKRRSEVLAMAELVPDVLDVLEGIEETVQDERGQFFHMFPNVGMSIKELRSQARLMDTSELYREAADSSDMGVACGLFCRR
jgi:hypothetical protein